MIPVQKSLRTLESRVPLGLGESVEAPVLETGPWWQGCRGMASGPQQSEPHKHMEAEIGNLCLIILTFCLREVVTWRWETQTTEPPG